VKGDPQEQEIGGVGHGGGAGQERGVETAGGGGGVEGGVWLQFC
jgi:hypothetical protein